MILHVLPQCYPSSLKVSKNFINYAEIAHQALYIFFCLRQLAVVFHRVRYLDCFYETSKEGAVQKQYPVEHRLRGATWRGVGVICYADDTFAPVRESTNLF